MFTCQLFPASICSEIPYGRLDSLVVIFHSNEPNFFVCNHKKLE